MPTSPMSRKGGSRQNMHFAVLGVLFSRACNKSDFSDNAVLRAFAMDLNELHPEFPTRKQKACLAVSAT